MKTSTCTETVQPLETLPEAFPGRIQETEAQASTVLAGRPLSPLVVGEAGENEIIRSARSKTVVAITVCATGLNALLASLVIITFPSIASDLHLSTELQLWPISVYSLTCGCTLLLLGSITDAVGSRPIYLAGCLFQTAFTLACGLSQTGAQIIIFRGFGGVASSFLLPSAVSIVSETFPDGKQRNMAFAFLGGSQPVGFAVGLLLGGLLSDAIGWRWGFYIASIVSGVVFALAFWAIPPQKKQKRSELLAHLKHEIDWIGIVIGSASVGLLSYAFTTITDKVVNITQPGTLVTLILSVVLAPAFVLWVGRQERLGKPAVIPNSLWRNRIFTTICLGLFLTWGAVTSSDSYQSLFFQEVQTNSPLQTSLRFLPGVVSASLSTLLVGFLAHRVHIGWAVSCGMLVTAVGILLMCIIQPEWSYWACAFLAVVLSPIGGDALYTVSNLVITSVFPRQTQALAGGVLNTITQLAKTVSLATSGAIAGSVTSRSRHEKTSPSALMEGYRAAFWYFFALACATILLFVWGLRGIGRLDKKKA
ncbi:integral membrane protein [Plenodomus tracheiphilus IPT5]|uniref:Integral membrane protein n=1 Tax=Plenodomus tracheiphilus IPT5 TaxID=1408161 RepID=A0A6A7APV4_9PLEO|nr:integral membrane protein [Plenodomus tracheiphilus IPT5]